MCVGKYNNQLTESLNCDILEII